MSMNIAIVTGASSGMGWEFVKEINRRYSKFDSIWVIARRKDRLEKLAKQVEIPLTILDMDLGNVTEREELDLLLKKVRPNIRLLVNCAGFGSIAGFQEDSRKVWENMVEINDVALTSICAMALPFMHRGARIINLASAAAFVPQPGFAVYAASKSYVLSFSRALAGELKSKGISVTAVCPGPVDTEFFEVADKEHKMKSFKKYFMVSPECVVSQALLDAKRKKEVSICGIWMKMFYVAMKVVPHRVVIGFMR